LVLFLELSFSPFIYKLQTFVEMRSFVVLLAVVVALAYGQVPCDIPLLFSGQFSHTESKEGHIAIFDFGFFYYDFVGGQVRIDLVAFQGEIIDFTIWENYLTSTGYYFDRTNGTCISFPLKHPLNQIQIPVDATFQETFTIGNAYFNSWSIPPAQPHPTIYEVLDVSDEICLPVSHLALNLTTATSQLYPVFNTQFANVAPSNPPFIFNVDAACTSDNVVKDEHARKYELFW